MSKSDEDEIRDIELRFNQAWGRHDPDGMIESLVDDAQFVTVNGAWTKTRDGFRDLMRRLHGANGPFRVSTRETPEICEYPDSGKYLAEGSIERDKPFDVIDRRGASLDYWDGEPEA